MKRQDRVRAGPVRRLPDGAFHRLLDRIDAGLVAGAIDAHLPDGTRRLIGGHGDGPTAVIAIVRWRALWRLASAGSVGWYAGWAAGDWTSPDPVPIFDLFMRNRATLGNVARAKRGARLAARVAHLLRRNDRRGARANVAAHYDLGNDFYGAWLDPGLTYSSALFGAGDTLAEAQQQKLDAILARTGAGPGDTLLEIGCGWGSFAETAARAGVRVRAITLSAEQQRVVSTRLAGMPAAVSLTDYRDVEGRYDAIASIEMVEAIGAANWAGYLDTIARLLRPGGRAAVQFIAIAEDIWPSYARGVDFIQAHIFPGGMLIREAAFRALAERAGLAWRDKHSFGPDYAETLRLWRGNFDAAAAEGRLPARFDSRFVDLWRYYLMYCEGGFRGGGIDVIQVTLVKNGVEEG